MEFFHVSANESRNFTPLGHAIASSLVGSLTDIVVYHIAIQLTFRRKMPTCSFVSPKDSYRRRNVEHDTFCFEAVFFQIFEVNNLDLRPFVLPGLGARF